MPKSDGPGSGPGGKLNDKLRELFDEEERLALEELRSSQRRLDDIRLRRSLALSEEIKRDDAPLFVDPAFVGKERGKQIEACLQRTGHAMSMLEITKCLRSGGALAGLSEKQGLNSVRLAIRYWSTSPEQRRQSIKKREKKMGKPTKHEPQTLLVRGAIESGLIGLVDWPHDKFEV